MRHVVSTDEVPHLWAHQTQDSARNAKGSLYFKGDTIYSYGDHFPIARIVENAAGVKAVLFTTRDYSVTTSRHKGMVWSAIPFGVFQVTSPDNTNFDAIFNDYETRIRLGAKAVLRARGRAEGKLQAVDRLVHEANRFAEFFGLSRRAIVPPEIDSAEFRAKAADWARRQNGINARRYATIQARRERQRDLRRQGQQATLNAWLAGEKVPVPWGLHNIYLRIEGNEIATTRGARFPVSHAIRAIPLIRRVKESGEPYKRNGHTVHLGHYAIEEIDKDGNVRAGCHFVENAEVERIAALLESRKDVAA